MTGNASLNDARWYFQEFVLPNYREFIATPLSPRRAFNAAVAMGHVVDHMVIRAGRPKGEVGNTRHQFSQTSPAYKQVQAMSNAFKHVFATGGGTPKPIATTSGVTVATSDTILFDHPIDGDLKEFRPSEPLLVCDYEDDGRNRKLLVSWTLYGALRFLAGQLNCGALLTASDIPPQFDLTYRTRPAT
jgi:hypothetical protein